MAFDWSFVEDENETEDDIESKNTCLKTFSSARQNLLDCSKTQSCNATAKGNSSSYFCAAENFECKYGFHKLLMGLSGIQYFFLTNVNTVGFT